MAYVFAQYWGFLLAALGFGLVAGLFSRAEANSGKPMWLTIFAIAFVIAAAIAAGAALPGRSGHYLEVALFMIAAYFIGCTLTGAGAGASLAAPGLAGLGTADLARAAADPATFARLSADPGAMAKLGITSQEDLARLAADPLALAQIKASGLGSLLLGKASAAQAGAKAVAGDIFASVPESYPGVRPKPSSAPAVPVDLTAITGIGALAARQLNDAGIHSFAQIAELSSENIAWLEHHIAYPGRIGDEGWTAQAQKLAGGGASSKDNGEQS